MFKIIRKLIIGLKYQSRKGYGKDMVEQEYKEQKCYCRMRDEYKEKFDEMVNDYAGILNNNSAENRTSIVFTLHDFNHHCFNIMKIISEVILSDTAYESTGLTGRELYILNLAVLFHDISMHADIDCMRKKHAIQSAEWIKKEYENSKSIFRKKSGLFRDEVKALSAIVKAHSDCEEKSAIYNEDLKVYSAKHGEIRANLLAGILRVADELDVTELRTGASEIEEQLREKYEEYQNACHLKTATDIGVEHSAQYEMGNLKKFAESYEHWERLYAFSNIQRRADQVVLRLSNDWFQNKITCGNEGRAEEIIKEVFEKISNEMLKVNKELFEKTEGFRSIIAVDRIIIEGVSDYLKEDLKTKYLQQIKEMERATDKKYIISKIENSAEIEQSITNLIEKRKLIQTGHYIMNSKYCARDWIKVQDIFENMELQRKCIESFISDLKKKDFKKIFLVGLDLHGAIIASTIGFFLGLPYGYIIPIHKTQYKSEKDRRFSCDPTDKIVFFSDAVSTFCSIEDATRTYNIKENQIVAIYTILYRPTNLEGGLKSLFDKYAPITYCINDKFPIEIKERENCERNSLDKCLASNNEIGLGGNRI